MVRASCLLICCLFGALLLIMPTTAYPRYNNIYRSPYQYDEYEPDQIVNMMNHLNDLIDVEHKIQTLKEEMISSEKRGLDMGLSRGYSGALQAKHLMGVAAANYAAGPGRRRRAYE